MSNDQQFTNREDGRGRGPSSEGPDGPVRPNQIDDAPSEPDDLQIEEDSPDARLVGFGPRRI